MSSSTISFSTAGKKILAIDDDAMVHKLLEFSLKDEAFPIVSVLGTSNAQQIVAEMSKDIMAIILDWEMPGMNGLDFLKWLKGQNKYREIPVIMLTGKSSREDVKMGIDAGAYYYVTKPFNKDFLRSILRAAVNDYLTLLNLKTLVENAKNPFDTLIEGTFNIRTLDEAQKLSVLIANATNSPSENLIICELFNNSIEHGNLGINYKEKSRLIDADMLFDEINRRLQLPENLNKYTVVKFKKEKHQLQVLIIDAGVGFDFKRYLHFDETRVFDTHGRGIALANSFLNIKYIGKGNKVKVMIPLK